MTLPERKAGLRGSFDHTADKIWSLLAHAVFPAPALVLSSYLLLALLILIAPGSLLQSVLAAALMLFGSGLSLTTVLFSRSPQLDIAERLALSGGLSLAIGSLIAFALTRTPWGLSLVPLLIANVLFNVCCLVIVMTSQRTTIQNHHLQADGPGKLVAVATSWIKKPLYQRFTDIALVLLLASGIGALSWAVLLPQHDPPLTEFYLLDQSGLMNDLPDTAIAGERLQVPFGIVNDEHERVLYTIQTDVAGIVVGKSSEILLEPGKTLEGRVDVHLPAESIGFTRVGITLLRDNRIYRVLHVWLEIKSSDNASIPSRGPFMFAVAMS